MIYKIKLKSIITEYDLKVIRLLYLPIIGANAVLMYHLFLDFSSIDSRFIQDELQINEVIFYEKLHLLEGVGLFQTYKNEKESLIEIYAPSEPKDFLNNIILAQLLKDKITASAFDLLVKIFKKETVDYQLYKNVSLRLADVFPYILNNTSSKINIQDVQNKESLSFDTQKFYKLLSEHQYKKNLLSPKLIELLKYYALVDSLNYEKIFEFIKLSFFNDIFDEIKFQELLKEFHNLKVNIKVDNSLMMSDSLEVYYTSVENFMKTKFKQTSPSEEIIINDIKINYGFPPELINIILDKTLTKCEGRLNKKYLESLALSLVRNKINNVEDAYLFFNKEVNKGADKLPSLIDIKENEEPNKSLDEVLKKVGWGDDE
jgi:replication initiation and membrane attachment protein